MQQLTYHPDSGLRWEEAEPPVLTDATQALVRPVAVAVCDADRAILAGKILQASPYPFGHEFVADIIEVGENVTTRTIGERVVVAFKISCGTCARCRSGHTAACVSVPLGSAYGFSPETAGSWGGAFSDVVRVPYADHMLVPLPAGLAAETAAPVGDNLADAYRCVAPGLQTHPQAPVLIMAGGGGAPSISLYAAAIAVALRSERVDYVDRDEARLQIAETVGAHPIHAERPPHDLGEYPITADTSGHPGGEWLRATIAATAPYGTCTSCGAYFHDLTMPLGTMYDKGIHFTTGWPNVPPSIPSVLELLGRGDLDLAPIHATTAWSQAAEAIPAGGYSKLIFVR